MKRREFIKTVATGAAAVAIDWSLFPVCARASYAENEFDAIIIGAGLGGLTCAAAFARQGFKPLVLERHAKVGGYASTFETRRVLFSTSRCEQLLPRRETAY